jgi:hypothetical protein
MPSTASVHDAIAVTNLLGRYAQCIDAGDLKGAAELFADATLKVGVDPDGPVNVDAAGILKAPGRGVAQNREENADNFRIYIFPKHERAIGGEDQFPTVGLTC